MFESILRFILNRVAAPIINVATYPFVLSKWKADSKHLPLKQSHKELYFIIHQHTARKLFKFPELVNCKDFNDKIQWLKLFDQDEKKIQCSDKLGVREYASEIVGDKYLVPLYQIVEEFDDIDFNSLPESFVLKTNHDSGTVVLVRDKKKLDKKTAKAKLESSLARKYGWEVGEWAYSFIKPKILIEYFIEPGADSAPPDYKFYCVNGKVKFCHYIYDRGVNVKEQLLNSAGQDLKVPLHPKFPLGNDFVLPNNWNEMISLAEKLSKGFKCVRVDLFTTSKGEMFIGEMTFWPMAGTYRGKGQKYHGKALDFDRKTYSDPIYHLKK